jgi:type II restriction/modification system DNA methylase subunit YeeA
MNTNTLKKFAQEARRKLMEQVGARLDFVLNTDTSALRERADAINKLRDAIKKTSKLEVIDRVTYTWFNRFMALRFMDANGFQPIGVQVLTPLEGRILPELLAEAKQGNIPEELRIKPQRIFDLLEGRIPSQNPENEVYKALLIGVCNHLNQTFPFLFERIDDFTELLLPLDLTSELSVIHLIREGMTIVDCQEVEIIGWLYQFYISEKKDEIFAAKSAVKKEDIPAATQLFTPRWIVEYMVQNTLGKLWLQNKPNSKLREFMPYFIESPSMDSEDFLKVDSVEEITLLDQACGSGHILVYAFELFTKIYAEEGYQPADIPQLILEKNLFGFEIDDRAAQLSGLALMMKARGEHRRFFNKNVKPNILCYQDLNLNAFSLENYKETIAIKNDTPELLTYLKYGYVLAQNIVRAKQELFTDDDTGEDVKIDKKDILVKTATQATENFWDIIREFGGDEILFYRDEIRDGFRLHQLPLNATIYHDLCLMTQATNFGSLILPKTATEAIQEVLTLINAKIDPMALTQDFHLPRLHEALTQLLPLSRKYHCIVDNPPYMGGGNMNKTLGDFVKAYYPDSKADLMACFMEAGLQMLHSKGFLGMINQHSWMFLSSYEKLREKLIANTCFDTLLHLGARTFPEIGGEVVQNASFVFWNTQQDTQGVYLRLVDFNSSDLKRTKTLEAIEELPFCKWVFNANQKDFEKIPGSPFGYWLSEKFIKLFTENSLLSTMAAPRAGLATGDNVRFQRFWCEVSLGNFKRDCKSNNESKESAEKWYPCNSGGQFRKWFGNNEFVVNWKKDGEEIRNFKTFEGKLRSRPQNTNYFFKGGLTWTKLSSAKFAVRFRETGFIFDDTGRSAFPNEDKILYFLIGLLCSNIANKFLELLNPTMSYTSGDIGNIPICTTDYNIDAIVKETIQISQQEWNSREISWDFQQNELMRMSGQDFEESVELYQAFWQKKFTQLHKNEEELNRQFIEIYGLQDELTPDVPLEDITILKEESSIKNGQLVFDMQEIIVQFISYSVGCMFGRYSLDKQGLILANQGEGLEEFLQKIALNEEQLSFVPDADNIIPILDDEWFEDDIAGRFKAFLKASFGERDFHKNLRFIEDHLGKDIRKYFTKDFYADHVKRYKKRPIYWAFSSSKGSFTVLIYMHRYNPDTLGKILNDYLVEYREKLAIHTENLENSVVTGSPIEQTKAQKEIDKIKLVLIELQEYERDILYPLVQQRIKIDLDEGVLVNYNKFGKAIKEISGLNDKATKKKVAAFDWIDSTLIQ